MARNYEPHVIRLDVFEDASSENVLYCYEAYLDEAGFDKYKGHPRPFQMWPADYEMSVLHRPKTCFRNDRSQPVQQQNRC